MLLLPHDGEFESVQLVVLRKRCELYLIDREFRISVFFPPQADKGFHPVRVIDPVRVAVAFSLIPEDAFERVIADGRPLAVVHDGGPAHGHENLLAGFRRRVEAGIPGHDLAGEPALDLGPAPGIVDHAHGHVQHLCQVLGEEPGGGAEVRHVLRQALFPGPLGDGQGLIGFVFGEHRKADAPFVAPRQGNLLLGAFNGAVVEAFHGHLHVALPASQPDLTDEHMLQRYGFLAAGNAYGMFLETAFRSGYGHFPGAVRSGLGRVFLLVP